MSAVEHSDPSQTHPTSRAGDGVQTAGQSQSLALLREWSNVVDAIAAGKSHVLIRKGGIAEGKDGFQVRRTFFGLLPTLFHQIKNAKPDADAPAPPSRVSIICQLVEAWTVPSTTLMDSISAFHAYSAEQLDTRQRYKPERPLNLMVIRAFRLRQPLEVAPGMIRTLCRSWAEVPLGSGLGGIDPVIDIESSDRIVSELRTAIPLLPEAERVSA